MHLLISVDLPISFLKINIKEINQSQTNAIKSMERINMLAYSLKSGQKEVHSAEVAVLAKLLQDEIYNELTSFGNSKQSECEFITLKTTKILTNLSCLQLQ